MTSISTSAPARCTPWSAPTARASRRSSRSCRATTTLTRARRSSSTASPWRSRQLGHGRHGQTARLSFVHQDLGQVLEMNTIDNLALHGGFARTRLGRIQWRKQARHGSPAPRAVRHRPRHHPTTGQGHTGRAHDRRHRRRTAELGRRWRGARARRAHGRAPSGRGRTALQDRARPARHRCRHPVRVAPPRRDLQPRRPRHRPAQRQAGGDPHGRRQAHEGRARPPHAGRRDGARLPGRGAREGAVGTAARCRGPQRRVPARHHLHAPRGRSARHRGPPRLGSRRAAQGDHRPGPIRQRGPAPSRSRREVDRDRRVEGHVARAPAARPGPGGHRRADERRGEHVAVGARPLRVALHAPPPPRAPLRERLDRQARREDQSARPARSRR